MRRVVMGCLLLFAVVASNPAWAHPPYPPHHPGSLFAKRYRDGFVGPRAMVGIICHGIAPSSLEAMAWEQRKRPKPGGIFIYPDHVPGISVIVSQRGRFRDPTIRDERQ